MIRVASFAVALFLAALGGEAGACTYGDSDPAERVRWVRKQIDRSDTIVIGVIRAGGGVKGDRYIIEPKRVLRGRNVPPLLQTHRRGWTSCGLEPSFGVDYARSPSGDEVVVLGDRRGFFGIRAEDVAFTHSHRGREILATLRASEQGAR